MFCISLKNALAHKTPCSQPIREGIDYLKRELMKSMTAHLTSIGCPDIISINEDVVNKLDLIVQTQLEETFQNLYNAVKIGKTETHNEIVLRYFLLGFCFSMHDWSKGLEYARIAIGAKLSHPIIAMALSEKPKDDVVELIYEQTRSKQVEDVRFMQSFNDMYDCITTIRSRFATIQAGAAAGQPPQSDALMTAAIDRFQSVGTQTVLGIHKSITSHLEHFEIAIGICFVASQEIMRFVDPEKRFAFNTTFTQAVGGMRPAIISHPQSTLNFTIHVNDAIKNAYLEFTEYVVEFLKQHGKEIASQQAKYETTFNENLYQHRMGECHRDMRSFIASLQTPAKLTPEPKMVPTETSLPTDRVDNLIVSSEPAATSSEPVIVDDLMTVETPAPAAD